MVRASFGPLTRRCAQNEGREGWFKGGRLSLYGQQASLRATYRYIGNIAAFAVALVVSICVAQPTPGRLSEWLASLGPTSKWLDQPLRQSLATAPCERRAARPATLPPVGTITL